MRRRSHDLATIAAITALSVDYGTNPVVMGHTGTNCPVATVFSSFDDIMGENSSKCDVGKKQFVYSRRQQQELFETAPIF
jgi:hypothetical protein